VGALVADGTKWGELFRVEYFGSGVLESDVA